MAQLCLRGAVLDNGNGSPAAIDAVLFDKDGTLSISEPMLLTLAEARVFQCLLQAQQRHPEQLAGDGARAELEQLLRRAYGLLPSAGVHPAGTTAVGSRHHNLISTATVLSVMGIGWPESLELAHGVFAATDALHGHGSPHRPSAADGLHELVERLVNAGVRCAVISNDEVAGIEAFLDNHGLRDHFCGLWSAEHIPCKPDPGAVHGLCEQLGVPAQRCALIGDANSDLRMARAAGVAVVLGYTAAWSTTPPLDRDFAQVDHWHELQVLATTGAPCPGE